MSSNSDRMLFGMCCALGLAGLAGWSGCVRRPAEAKRVEPAPAGYTLVKLGELNAAPRDFLLRKVRFEAYFVAKTDLYQPFRTQFTSAEHVNFAVWPLGTKLWLPAEMDARLPFMYVARDSGEIIEKNPERLLQKLDRFERYQPITVYGTVVSDYNNFAWVLVEAFRTMDRTAYTAESLRRLQLATERFGLKMYALAAKDYAAALPLGVPGEVEGFVHRNLGLCQLGLEDYAGAARELAAAERLGGADAEALIGLAEARIETGQFIEAERSARAALVKNPHSVPARAQLAVALGSQGRTAAGLDECADALRLAPADADALRAQGIVLDLAGKEKLDAAIESYKQAVLARATDARIQRELGQLFVKKGDFASARVYFENVLNLSKGNTPGYCRACCLLAGALEGLKKPDEALNCYLLAQKRDDAYVPAYLGLGALYAAAGREKEARDQYLVVAEKLDPKGDNGFVAWKRLAELYRASPQNMAKAADCYVKALAIKPGEYGTCMDLASSRWERAEPDLPGVVAAYRQAVAARPSEAAPHYRMGIALGQLGRPQEAAAEFEAAKRLDPADVANLLRLGQTYRRLCRDPEALKELEAAAAADPANLDVKNSLAYALADAGGPEGLKRARKLAGEAVAAKPGEPAYQDTLGWVQAKLGETRDALATLEKAANASSDADVLYHLGYAYAADRQYEEASKALDKAELKLRQGRMSCPSCKRLAAAVQKLLVQVRQDKARGGKAAPPAKPPAPVKK